MTFNMKTVVKSSVVLGTLLLATSASADVPDNVTSGRAEVYKQLDPGSLEQISTRTAISALMCS